MCNSLRAKTLRLRKLGWTCRAVFERLPDHFPLFRFKASITMTSFLHSVGKLFLSGHWWLAVTLVLALGISGCKSWDMRGEGFADDDMASSARDARPEKRDIEYWGYSEKARQIERNLQKR